MYRSGFLPQRLDHVSQSHRCSSISATALAHALVLTFIKTIAKTTKARHKLQYTESLKFKVFVESMTVVGDDLKSTPFITRDETIMWAPIRIR